MLRVDPRVDLIFKKLFGVEENKDLLISLINSVVSEEDQVRDVTILNPHNAQNFKGDKLSILDVKAEGLAEGLEKAAINMLEKSIDTQTISEATGLCYRGNQKNPGLI